MFRRPSPVRAASFYLSKACFFRKPPKTKISGSLRRPKQILSFVHNAAGKTIAFAHELSFYVTFYFLEISKILKIFNKKTQKVEILKISEKKLYFSIFHINFTFFFDKSSNIKLYLVTDIVNAYGGVVSFIFSVHALTGIRVVNQNDHV